MYVYMDGTKSNNFFMSRGVLQGSILGPLSYSINFNALTTKLKLCNAQKYADDYQMYISSLPSDITNCIETIKCDMHSVFQWASINGLWLNSKKLKSLIIGKV